MSVVTEPDRSKLTPPVVETKPHFPEPNRRERDDSCGSSSGDPQSSNQSKVGVSSVAGTPHSSAPPLMKPHPAGVAQGTTGQDFTTVINTTFDSLKTTLVKSLPNTGEELPEEEISQVRVSKT